MNTRLLTAAVALLPLAGCKPHSHSGDNAGSVKEIQQVMATWQKAFEAKDLNGVMATYATGDAVTAFDVVPPLQYKGADAYRKDYADVFSQVDGPLHVEFRDNHIEAAGDLGLAYGLEHITGRMKSGAPLDLWVRYTSGFKKIDGQWRDIHDHVSVPADMNSGKALLDLKP
jgi:ketosteroid isomerase-like protein